MMLDNDLKPWKEPNIIVKMIGITAVILVWVIEGGFDLFLKVWDKILPDEESDKKMWWDK